MLCCIWQAADHLFSEAQKRTLVLISSSERGFLLFLILFFPVSYTHLVQDGEVQAKIVWSSSNYDYMEVDGKSYSPVNETGNSTFLIDDVPFDEEVPVLAETTAMSQPHMIEYSIYVHGDTLQSTDSSPALAIGLSLSLIHI